VLEIGAEVLASLMNSRNERARNFGHRLFERAKQGGERAKPNPGRL
jgi:hypothetical protein